MADWEESLPLLRPLKCWALSRRLLLPKDCTFISGFPLMGIFFARVSVLREGLVPGSWTRRSGSLGLQV